MKKKWYKGYFMFCLLLLMCSQKLISAEISSNDEEVSVVTIQSDNGVDSAVDEVQEENEMEEINPNIEEVPVANLQSENSVDDVQKENEIGEIYQVFLQVQTDGNATNGQGGVLTTENNILSGKEGDIITLIPKANPGYEFVKYSSFRADNNMSTDGLMSIENNQFTLSEKIGSVIVVAEFVTKKENPNEYFADDFEDDSLSSGRYEASSGAAIKDGKLILSPTAAPVTVFPILSKNIDESNHNGYTINFQLQQIGEFKPYNTVQVVFRRDSNNNRYVLEFSGQRAFIKEITVNNGVDSEKELAAVDCLLTDNLHKIKMTVQDGKISVTNNEKPLISYDTGELGWNVNTPDIGFIAKSAYRTIAIDNLSIAKIDQLYPLTVITRLDGEEDKGNISGSVTVQSYSLKIGDNVKIEPSPKPGYQFKQFTDSNGQVIDLATYVVPQDISNDGITIYVDFIRDNLEAAATTYYIDSTSGNDMNDGQSQDLAWSSLSKLRNTELNPGDTVLIKKGSIFSGKDASIIFKGSGTKENPILIGTYGEGNRPRLEAHGEVANVISLYNQEYITIEGLEITNLDATYNTEFGLNTSNNKEKILRAVNVSAKDFGIVHNILLKDLYIHDINGNLNSKWNGGIFFDVKATKEGNQIKGIPTKYDNILIENCEFENVDRSAIKLVSSDWSNQSLKNNPDNPINWYPSTNVVVRNNKINKIGGDGITVRDTDHALIEYNVVGDARYQNTGYNAGIWPFQASNTVIQYNEVYRTHGVQDGQGLDCDHLSSYTVMQYNYSHDNEGGFMLVMNGFPHTAPTIRYNISQNDKDKTIEFARGTPAGTMFYNNTFYSDSTLTGRGGIIDLPNTKAGTGNRDVFFFNNLFYYPAGQAMYVKQSDALSNLDKFHFYNNAYFGGISVPNEEKKAIVENPYLKEIGSGPTENVTGIATAGNNLSGQLDGYLPQENSSLIGKGISLAQAIQYFSGQAVTDDAVIPDDSQKHGLSPTELFEMSKTIDSIHAVATSYPVIDGVSYTTDFFGTTLPTSKNVTIGAGEFVGTSSNQGEKQ